MFKKVLTYIIIIVFGFYISGCSSESNEKVVPIKIGIFPVDARDETYFISINQTGVLKVLFGEQKNGYLEESGFIKDVGHKISRDITNNNFIKPNISREKNLTKKEIQKIANLVKKIDMEEMIEINGVYKGPVWVVTVIVSDKVYTFYYVDQDKNSYLRSLVDEIIKCSPMKIQPPNRY